MITTTILFYIISALILFTAIMMVSSKNLTHSALFMAATFIGIAFIYLLLETDYMAIVQVLVYVGAVSVLFIFGVMLTRRDDMEESNQPNRYKVYGRIVAVVLLLVLGSTIFVTGFAPVATTSDVPVISAVSNLLLNDYAIPFEVSGILLLTAMVGAIIIGQGVKNTK